jgi:hypothetical protein
MDRAFIDKNQIIERYLTGKLPYQGAQDFERYCRENPQVLEELKFGEHLHAGMRLLEASGWPPGFTEPPLPWWRRWEVSIGVAVFALAFGISLWVLGAKYAARLREIATLEQRLEEGPMKAPGNRRSIKVIPNRSGPSDAPAVTLRLKESPDLVELFTDVSFAQQNVFRVIIDKKDQVRAGTLYNLLRDSNGALRWAINTSALQAGDYNIAIEGIPFRGDPVPVAWLTVRVTD